jgi:hypothetical protein
LCFVVRAACLNCQRQHGGDTRFPSQVLFWCSLDGKIQSQC